MYVFQLFLTSYFQTLSKCCFTDAKKLGKFEKEYPMNIPQYPPENNYNKCELFRINHIIQKQYNQELLYFTERNLPAFPIKASAEYFLLMLIS